MHRIVILFISFLFSFQCLLAQKDFNVTIIYDRQQKDTLLLQNSFKEEIESLLSPTYNVTIKELFSNGDINNSSKCIEEVYHENTSDVLKFPSANHCGN